MRNLTLILCLFLSPKWAEASNYWMQYFLECSAITGDESLCYEEIQNQLITALRIAAPESAGKCGAAAKTSAACHLALESKLEIIRRSSDLAVQNARLGTTACIQDNMATFSRVLNLIDQKEKALRIAASTQNEDLCEQGGVYILLMSTRLDTILDEVHRCYGAPKILVGGN